MGFLNMCLNETTGDFEVGNAHEVDHGSVRRVPKQGRRTASVTEVNNDFLFGFISTPQITGVLNQHGIGLQPRI